MATVRIPILGMNTAPDASGFVFPDRIANQLSIGAATRPPGNEMCIVMQDPNGGGDAGLYGKFAVPKDYVGTPVLVIRGVLDGAPTTTTIAFGVQMRPLADDEAFDGDYGAEAIASASSVSQADEDVYEETIDISGFTFAVDDDVFFFFYVDDSVHTYTGNFLLTGLYFQYANA